MIRKIVSVAAASLALTTAFGTLTAAPAHADTTSLRITIGYDTSSSPNVGVAAQPGGDLVGTISGVVGGEVVDATSCTVEATSLESLIAGGGTAVVGNCADGSGWAASVTPHVDPEGGLSGSGALAAEGPKWKGKVKCKTTFFLGYPVWVECEAVVEVSSS